MTVIYVFVIRGERPNLYEPSRGGNEGSHSIFRWSGFPSANGGYSSNEGVSSIALLRGRDWDEGKAS
jgi:hypothetical protein